MALVFQRRHHLCPIQTGIESNPGQTGSDEDMAPRGEEEEEEEEEEGTEGLEERGRDCLQG